MLDRTSSKLTDLGQRVDAYSQAGPGRRRLRSLVLGMAEHHAARAASAMAFELFLASIPMLAVVGWLAADVLQGSSRALMTVSVLLEATPSQVNQLITAQLGRFAGSRAIGSAAVLGSLWLSAGAFHRVMNVLELALHAERRSWFKKRGIALGFVILGLLALGISGYLIVLIAGGPTYLLRLATGADPSRGALVKILTPFWALVVATGLVAGFFRVSVVRPDVKRHVWPGALLAVAIGGGASYLFAYYAKTLARFTMFYGSLAAVAILLIWLWLCCAALLLGAELNAQLEGLERTSRSSRQSGDVT